MRPKRRAPRVWKKGRTPRVLLHEAQRLAPTLMPELLARLLRQTLPLWHPSPTGPKRGRPFAPLHALVYQAVMRVAYRQSLRSSTGAMDAPSHRRLNHHGGLTSSTVSRFMVDPASTILLEKLLAVTTWPVRHVEHLVHPDGTGLTENHTEPFQPRGGPPTRRHTYRYMEALWTYRYTLIASVYSQRGGFGEAPWLLPLVERARLVLDVRELGGDAAYDAGYVRDYAQANGIHVQVIRKGKAKWRQDKEARRYMELAHRRNNAEAGNHAFKELLGEHLYSTHEIAQRNEVLCMAIAYNLLHLIQFSLDQGKQIRFHLGARHIASCPWVSLEELREQHLGRG
jgi:hypothetical protein